MLAGLIIFFVVLLAHVDRPGTVLFFWREFRSSIRRATPIAVASVRGCLIFTSSLMSSFNPAIKQPTRKLSGKSSTRGAKPLENSFGKLFPRHRSSKFTKPTVPLQSDAFKVKGSKLDLLIFGYLLEIKILLCFIYPPMRIVAIKLGKVEF
ncbi:hypothetical protein K2173_014431 [Erythroxylum novogranatense]|uniref:Uncharacterized protein n=1 Tax=Erythroxylum novogranatense TaxID=1862640 RepID=A0AAV8S7F3_9ROSI|nr:hypothetical protein K2173_014431 [Erythroxylum novogranatense]